MKETQGRQGTGRRARMRIRTKITTAFLGLSIIALALFGYLAFSNMMEMGNYALVGISSLGQDAVADGTRDMEALGQAVIAQKARDTARQADIYIKGHPKMTIADLQATPEFQQIAVQKVGETGYTSIMDIDTGYFYFHPQERLVNTDTHVFAQTLPAVWKILDQTIGKYKESDGYYDWQEADGSIRQKYMALTLIPG